MYRQGEVITDLATPLLTVHTDRRLCRVAVYGADVITSDHSRHPKKAEVLRFCAVWSELLASVTAPNDWQKPGLCR